MTFYFSQIESQEGSCCPLLVTAINISFHLLLWLPKINTLSNSSSNAMIDSMMQTMWMFFISSPFTTPTSCRVGHIHLHVVSSKDISVSTGTQYFAFLFDFQAELAASLEFINFWFMIVDFQKRCFLAPFLIKVRVVDVVCGRSGSYLNGRLSIVSSGDVLAQSSICYYPFNLFMFNDKLQPVSIFWERIYEGFTC